MQRLEEHDSVLMVSGRQKRELLAQLSDYDHTRSWKRARKECIGATCQWLMKTREFQEWKTDAASSMLLCTGKCGWHIYKIPKRHQLTTSGFSGLGQDHPHVCNTASKSYTAVDI